MTTKNILEIFILMWMKKLSPLWLCSRTSDWSSLFYSLANQSTFDFWIFGQKFACHDARLKLFFSYFFPEKIVKWSPHVLLIECSMFTPNQSINILLLNIALCTKFIFLNRYILCNFEYQVDWFFEKKFFTEEGAI